MMMMMMMMIIIIIMYSLFVFSLAKGQQLMLEISATYR